MAKPSRIDFLNQVEQLIAGKFPLVKMERDESEFSLRINGQWTRLENLYRLTAEHPEQLQRQVERWVVELLRAAEGPPDQSASFEEVRERIYPMVVGSGKRDVSGMAMISQKVLEGLSIAYVLDSQRTVAYVPKHVFEQWGISLEELHEVAMENLVARSQTLQAHAAQDAQGRPTLVLIQTLDGYDATRILLPGLHDHLREHLGSPFLAGIPNRDVLVCFRNEPELVDRMRTQIAEDYRTMPHQVSNGVFLVTADGIAVFEPAV